MQLLSDNIKHRDVLYLKPPELTPLANILQDAQSNKYYLLYQPVIMTLLNYYITLICAQK